MELGYGIKKYYEKDSFSSSSSSFYSSSHDSPPPVLLLLPFLLFPSPPSIFFFFLRSFHYVTQVGLGVVSAGITGISAMPRGIVPLTVHIMWDIPLHTCTFPKKQLLTPGNCLTLNYFITVLSSPRRLLIQALLAIPESS